MAHQQSEISRLTERWSELRTSDISAQVRTPSDLQVVKVYKSNNDTTANRIFFTYLRKMNAVNYSEGDLQLCGYYASCILSVFPTLQSEFTRAISELGGKVSIVTNNLFEAMAFELTHPRPSPALLVAACQLFLLLFKKATCSLSYVNDMKSAITALKSQAGCTTILTDLIAAKFEMADKIRIMLGSVRWLRKFLFETIHKAAELESTLGYCCNYVARMLAWTDMSELVLINDVLVVTNSPVLGDSRVASEVKILRETFNVINQSSYPQFFGITTVGFDVRLLDGFEIPIVDVGCTGNRRQSITHP